ncbi:unnamed protein product [Mytilus edulis]|uniref:Uncharacterized protein n=1 Tax=Mytilus edulis TaxID=6550 RepID=A0A8S3UYC9_MYTED|nr:unnamed protein product [Mytilus edulis]
MKGEKFIRTKERHATVLDVVQGQGMDKTSRTSTICFASSHLPDCYQDDIITEGWSDVNFKNPVPPDVLDGAEEYLKRNQSKDITFVTAYFNLGKFQKGPFKTFSTQTYYSWMKNYAFVYNEIILYTDLEELAIKFKEERSHFPDHMTRIFLVKQNEFWAFGLIPKIEKIYNQTDYPKWYPNTVMASYSCAMHVKYDLIQRVIKEKLVKTKYLAWMDIGYFRGNEKGTFSLKPPKNIKDDHIAFVQIDKYVDMTPKEIMFSNSVFLAGGLFIGRPEYLLLLVEDYRKAVEKLIAMNLMNTDQQVLYCMYSPKFQFQPRIPIQRFYSQSRLLWFYLGDLCRESSLFFVRKKTKLSEVIASSIFL